jgi:zinc protease
MNQSRIGGLTGRGLRFLVAGMLFAASFSVAASADSLRLPPHEKIVLKNGLTLLVMEKRGVPMVSLSAIVKTGAAADPPGEEGLAAATAGLLRKGSKNRSAQQFAADLDYIGGTFEADSGADFTGIAAEFLTKDAAKGLELFADALIRPLFPQDEVEKFLAQALDGVRAEKDDPRQVMLPYFNGYLYGTHPYGRAAGGDEVSLKKIERAAITGFYENYYAPGNTIVALAGDFDAAEMKKRLEDVLGNWPAHAVKTVTIPAAPTVKGKRLLVVDKPDSTQTYFAIGNTGVAENDPDRVAIRVVNTIFGGSFTSELNEALRVESGYSYGAESFFDERKVAGPFAIFSFTKNETTTPAIDLTLQVLERLHKDGVTEKQLASAKSFLKGQYPPEIETSRQLAQIIAAHEFYGLGDDEVNEFEARVDAVTPEMAKQAIAKHFPAQNLVFVLIGNGSSIGPAVQKYAPKQDSRKVSDPGFWPPPQM